MIVNSKCRLVAGLAGSGKTPYLNKLKSVGWTVFDDFKANARNNSPYFKNARCYEELILTLQKGRNCVVADMDFCKLEAREEAERILRQEIPTVVIEWRFLENNPEQCEKNIRQGDRELDSRLKKLKEYTAKYSIPNDATIIPVYHR